MAVVFAVLGSSLAVMSATQPIHAASPPQEEGGVVSQQACPPGTEGENCKDGIVTPQPVAKQIVFENTAPATVILGAKAVRSQGGALTRSDGQALPYPQGTGPYTIKGTGSDGVAYTYQTGCNYGGPAEDGCSNNQAGNKQESEERAGTLTTTKTTTNYTDSAGTTVSNALFLQSSGSITGTAGASPYGSIFGPEVYTEKFTAKAGEGVAFRFAALGVSDEYEYYAWLVDVATNDYNAGTHTLVGHGRGKNQRWRTLKATIPADGTYRFRFTNGTYDGSGGLAVGSNLYLDPIVWVGLENEINQPAITDKVLRPSDSTFTVVAKPTSNGFVTFSTNPTSRCTVGSSSRYSDTLYSYATVTIKGSGSGGSVGQCTVFASSQSTGLYVPPPQVFRNFQVCTSNLADGGGHSITGVAETGNNLFFESGTITSCGDNYDVTAEFEECVSGDCTLDSHFRYFGGRLTKSGTSMTSPYTFESHISLSDQNAGARYRAKMTVTDGVNTFTYRSALGGPVRFVPRATTTTTLPSTTIAGPTTDPKPFVLPSGDTPRAEPGKVVVFEGGAPVVVTSSAVTVGGVQSVKVGGTGAGGGNFEMTIGGDCPTCAVTKNNTGENILGLEQSAGVRVGGIGFAPDRQVNVFVSSTTRLLGSFKADGDGAFLGTVNVPTDLPADNHTIQLSGFTPDNVIRSVSVGLTVDKATPKSCRVVKRKGKKPVAVCPKKVTKKVAKKK